MTSRVFALPVNTHCDVIDLTSMFNKLYNLIPLIIFTEKSNNKIIYFTKQRMRTKIIFGLLLRYSSVTMGRRGGAALQNKRGVV